MGEHVKEAAAPRRYRVTFLSVIGELLITIAVILGLCAVWQLYWTTYKVEGPRAQAVADFSSKHPSNRTLGERHTDDPPEFTLNPAIDELYGVIHVPSWNWMKIPLGEGTTGSVIDQGWAGHYKDTAQPGQVGNFSVAAHRRSYGNSFRFIDLLKDNDKVVVETDNVYLVYTYESNEIVPASDETNIRVIAPVPGDLTFSKQPTERLMTMTTCNPEYGNSERFIVHLKLESWTPKSTGVPAELLDEPVE